MGFHVEVPAFQIEPPPLSSRITFVPSEAKSTPLINPPPPSLSGAQIVWRSLDWDRTNCADDWVQRNATHAANNQDVNLKAPSAPRILGFKPVFLSLVI